MQNEWHEGIKRNEENSQSLGRSIYNPVLGDSRFKLTVYIGYIKFQEIRTLVSFPSQGTNISIFLSTSVHCTLSCFKKADPGS